MIFQTDFLTIIGAIAIIVLLFMIPLIFLLIFFLYKFTKTRQTIIGYLVIMIFSYLSSIFLVVFQFIAFNQERAEIYFIFSEISNILVIFFLLLIFEIFYKNTQLSRRQTVITILVFMIIGGLLARPEIDVVALEGRFFIMDMPLFSSISIFKLLLTSFATIFLISMLTKSRKNAWNPKQKTYITWLLLGSLIGVLLPALIGIFFDNVFIIGQEIGIINQIIQVIPKTISILIIGLIFFKISKNLWLLQHQQVYFLIVYSPTGITLYSKSFSEDITQADTQLLAGAFSAVSALIKDGTKTSGRVEAIMLEGKLLKIINRKKFICALLVEYSTQASDDAHKKFTLEFEKKFYDTLENFNGEVSPFHSADKIIDKYFT